MFNIIISKLSSKQLVKYFRKWHQKLGVLVAFFLICLSLTGIALNHTDSLSLAHYSVKSNWLLNHYNILRPNDIRRYTSKGLFVTDNIVWLNKRFLVDAMENIVAVVYLQETIVIISTNKIYLFSENGELIDKLGQLEGIPNNIIAAQVVQKSLIIKTPEGVFKSNNEFSLWQEITSYNDVIWLHTLPLSPVELEKVSLLYRAKLLTLERIIVDIHSGRILGLFGVLFMDVVAILLILLSASGVWVYAYTRAKQTN